MLRYHENRSWSLSLNGWLKAKKSSRDKETPLPYKGNTMPIRPSLLRNRQIQFWVYKLCKIRKQPEVSSSSSSYSKSKVEVFTDSNEYDSSFVKFYEWWAKMKGWLNINHYVIEEGSYNAVIAVLSQLKGPKAGPFAQVQLQKSHIYI